ncbi:hypothetical protein BC835DRAFT_150590 [Cytidiella melzeri]|nr:hypothetical protein BC835DRAFT_150590 [Cytidiella melzeri]
MRQDRSMCPCGPLHPIHSTSSGGLSRTSQLVQRTVIAGYTRQLPAYDRALLPIDDRRGCTEVLRERRFLRTGVAAWHMRFASRCASNRSGSLAMSIWLLRVCPECARLRFCVHIQSMFIMCTCVAPRLSTTCCHSWRRHELSPHFKCCAFSEELRVRQTHL